MASREQNLNSIETEFSQTVASKCKKTAAQQTDKEQKKVDHFDR
jgi:hypothetical protein